MLSITLAKEIFTTNLTVYGNFNLQVAVNKISYGVAALV